MNSATQKMITKNLMSIQSHQAIWCFLSS